MDALKFLEEFHRMCIRYCCCEECPMKELQKEYSNGFAVTREKPEEAVSIIKKWSEENPVVVNGARVMESIKELGVTRATFFPYDTNDICVYFDKDWWDAPYGG